MRAVRGVGELLITAGLVLLLFVAYQLVWTNIEADRRTDRVADAIRESWERPPTTSGGGSTGTGGRGPTEGDFARGFAFLHIPRLGDRFSVPVVEGVALSDLSRGVGHYPQTARPGQVGNFAVAGHRATNGEPFANLDRVRKGDLIVTETRRRWFTYTVDRVRIVSPTSTWVLDPVPGTPDAEPVRELITLTTCNPRWASYERLIVFGHLVGDQPKSAGPPEALVRRGGRA